MLTFLRLGGTSLGAWLTSPGLFILLTASAVLVDFGSCATNELHVTDVSDKNLTAYYPEVKPADGKWHTVDPSKLLAKSILVRIADGVYNIEFVAPLKAAASAVTLIDGFNKGCQFYVKCAKNDKDGYLWTLKQRAPKDKEFTEVVKDVKDLSGTLRVEFKATGDKPKIQYWSGHGQKPKESLPVAVKCGMSTQPAIDDTLHSEQKTNVASIDLSTEAPAGENKVAPLEVKWEMPIVFAADDPTGEQNTTMQPTTTTTGAAPGFPNVEITVTAIVVMQMLLTALRD